MGTAWHAAPVSLPRSYPRRADATPRRVWRCRSRAGFRNLSLVRLVPAVAALALALGGCEGSTETAAQRSPTTASPTTASPSASALREPSSIAPRAGPGPAVNGHDGSRPVLLGDVADPALAESSGLVASRRDPDLLWTHNDSGDEARLYCLTRAAARCGTWAVTGAEAVDWEDMAAGPGPVAGRPYLYVGDIGDNRRARSHVAVYRLAEPSASGPANGSAPAAMPTSPAVALRLRYDDGAHDAEALLVHPATADLYVITKDPRRSGVYKAAEGSTTLSRIADLQLGLAERVTGADISPDGRRVALCTYRQAYELALPTDGAAFDEIWEQPPRRFDLGGRAQGEAIAYRLDGKAVLTTSEGSPFPLHEVPRP